MQRKKNLSLLISLLVLTCVTALIYWLGNTDSAADTDKDLFKVADLTTVDRIVLRKPTDTISLAYTSARWKVNGKYDADRDMMDILFATLQQIEARRPVADRIQDSVSKQLLTTGVSVSLYKGSELQKEFIAGGNAQRTQAYFMDIQEHIPYVMAIPGYHGYASGIMEIGENDWRDKYVFGFNWQHFQRMEVSFPGSPADNFVVSMKDHMVSIEGIAEPDTSRLNTFLNDVSLLTVQQYVTGSEYDSLQQTVPLMKIVIRDVAEKEYSLALYPVPAGSRRVVGIIGGIDAALFAQRSLKPVQQPRSYFLKKDL